MSTIEILKICLAWETFLQSTWFWREETMLGEFHVKLLLKHGGREPCERVALFWHEHGRDDISMKIKAILNNEGTNHDPTP
jgi:hypothetical protein